MKTMTCRQMGGPCDTAIHGSNVDEMAQNGMEHIKSKAKEGDMEHKKVMDMMNDKATSEKWYEEFKMKFDSQPAD